MAYQDEFEWKTKSGKKIYAYHWAAAEPKAVICLVHGLGEHCRRYDHMAAYYNDKGYSVISFDNVGHGRSEGKRGHVTKYQIFMDNIQELIQQADKAYPLLPKFLYGHSLGGNMSLNYTLRNHPEIAGLVTTGAFVTLPEPAPKLLVLFGKIMRNIVPSLLQSNNLNAEHVSKDEKVVNKYVADPLVH
ncbi:MAG: alpha/beta fold hydrolase, partial [Bacteroidota bacterium]